MRNPGPIMSASRGCSLQAGSSVEWIAPQGAPGPERTLEGLIELRRAAEAP